MAQTHQVIGPQGSADLGYVCWCLQGWGFVVSVACGVPRYMETMYILAGMGPVGMHSDMQIDGVA